MSKQKFAIVGLGSRANMYVSAITQRYPERAELVGLCDVNAGRMAMYNNTLPQPVPTPSLARPPRQDMRPFRNER